MSWTKLDESPSVPAGGKRYRKPSTRGYVGHDVAKESTRLVTWRCDGCRKLAVTGGGEPGACLFRGCRFFKPS